jgi:hypothetical protein
VLADVIEKSLWDKILLRWSESPGLLLADHLPCHRHTGTLHTRHILLKLAESRRLDTSSDCHILAGDSVMLGH